MTSPGATAPRSRARTTPVRLAVGGLGLAGAVLLGVAVTRPPGSAAFLLATAGTASCWLLGGLAAGRPPLGDRRPWVPLGVAVGAWLAFVAAALVVRAVPPLDRAVGDVLQLADSGRLPLVLTVALATGLAEEVYFRGALWQALPRHRLVLTTLAYAATTGLATRNPALVLAALALGAVLGWQRQRAGGLLAPVVTHLVWTVLVVLLLPR